MIVGFRQLNYRRDWPWVLQQLPLAWTDNSTGVVAFDDADGSLIAAMVCESWTKNSVQCHFMVTHIAAFRHGFPDECARYVFTIGDREKMIGIVPSNNKKALKVNKHFGFTEVATIDDAYWKGCHAVIMEMHRDDCKYWYGFDEERRVASG